MRLEPHLPVNGGRGAQWSDHRRVLNGIYFRERTGVPWRDLPVRYGNWKTVYERHRRWSADGTWDRILKAVQAQADAEGRLDWSQVSVDSTTCRAHQHAAGARKAAPTNGSKRGQSRPATAPTRDSDDPAAASPARFTWPAKAVAGHSVSS